MIMKEVETSQKLTEEIQKQEHAKKLVLWVIHHIAGQGVPSTIHYEGEDVEEWAVPISHLPQVEKELMESLKDLK